ncbi:MAG: phosphatidylinositol kinase [Bacteroides sp.]|nr:phosphatidylinositol kinase [Bacteroides sp.]
MKQAKVFISNTLAGILTEDEAGYEFMYLPEYLASDSAMPVSLTLPLSDKQYRDKVLFPFFDGLIPEGWLLDIAEQSWKISARDRFSLLLACCKDCIGNVSVIPMEESEVIDA